MSRFQRFLAMALISSGCASAPGLGPSSLELRQALASGDRHAAARLAKAIVYHGKSFGTFREVVSLLGSSREASAQVLVALALESIGDLAGALKRWSRIAVTSASVDHRSLASRRVLALVDMAPLDRDIMMRLSTASKRADRSGILAAEALEQVGIRLEHSAHTAAARQRMGAVKRYAIGSSLLSSLPATGLVTSSPVPSDGGMPATERYEVKHVHTTDGTIALPAVGPGVFAVWVDAPESDSGIEIEIWGAPAARVFDGPNLVGVNDRLGQYAPRRVRFPISAGPRRTLQLHLATRDIAAEVRVFVRQNRSVHWAVKEELGSKLNHWLSDWSDGSYERPRFDASSSQRHLPLVAVPWAAQALIDDPSIPRNVGHRRARQLLMAALERAPDLSAARAMLVALAMDGGDATTAEGWLRQGRVGQWKSSLNAMIAEDRQQMSRLRELVDEERKRLPTSCETAQRWLDARTESLRLQASHLETTLPGCFSVQLRRAMLLRQAWRHDAADRLLTTLETRARPGSQRAALSIERARLAVSRALPKAAYAAAIRGLQEGRHIETLLKLARTSAELERAPKKVGAIEQTMRRQHHLGSARRSVLRPREDLGLPLTDGHKLALSTVTWRRSNHVREPTTLLDEHHLSVLPGAVMVHRVHRVMYLNDEDAVSALGEIPIPEEAEVLVARTWKPTGDGRMQPIEPEDMGADKGAISLPALSAGAVVEVAWFWTETPSERGVIADRLAPGWVTPRFSFASKDARVSLSRFVLRVRTGEPLTIQRYGAAPEHLKPEPQVWMWEARELPRFVPEPLDPRPDRRSPGVRVSLGVTVDDIRRTLGDMLRGTLRQSREIQAFIQRHKLQKTSEGLSPRAQLQRLFRAVTEHVKQDGRGRLETSASFTAAAAVGSRVTLLVSACRAMGMACDIVLARPRQRGKRLSDNVMWTDDYVYPLVRVALGSRDIWLDPSSAFMPFDYLPPAVQGVHAMVPESRHEHFVMTPAFGRQRQGHHRLELTVAVDPSGGVKMGGSETLDGFFGASWRHSLNDLPQNARRRALARIIQNVVPSAQVERVRIENLDQNSQPLRIHWTARGALQHLTEKRRALRLGLHPQHLVRQTVRGPVRQTPLLIQRPIRSDVRIQITLPDGAKFVASPPPFDTVRRLVSYVRSSRLGPERRRLWIQRKLDVAVGTIEPERYPNWVRLARSVDQRDAMYLEVDFP